MRSHPFFLKLLSLAGMAVLPLLVLLGVEEWNDIGTARTAAIASVRDRSAAVAQDTAAVLARAQRFLEFLSNRDELLNLDRKRCSALLASMAGLDPLWGAVGVVDLEGERICASTGRRGPVPASFSGMPWFPDAVRADGFAISRPFVSRMSGRTVALLSQPLRAADGTRIGLVVLSIDLERFALRWRKPTWASGEVVALIDASGLPMVRLPPAPIAADAVTQLPSASFDRRYPDGTGSEFGRDGVERLFAVAPVPLRPWNAVAGLPTELVFARSRQQLTDQGLAVGAAALLAVALAWSFARRLAAPLESLAATVRSVASGRKDTRADESGSGEFRAVACEFNRMLEARDVADEHGDRSERFAARLAAIHTALLRTNQSIVRARDANTLFQEICQICVDTGHARMACAGLVQGAQYVSVTFAGRGTADLAPWRIDLDPDAAQAQSPTPRALRLGCPQVSNDLLADPRAAAWREFARHLDLRAVAAIPFHRGGRIVGALSFYSDEPGFFDAPVVELLCEMARDLSFALDNIDRDAARAVAEARLRDSLERFELAASSGNVWYWDRSEGEFFDASQIAHVLGYQPHELPAADNAWMPFVHDDDKIALRQSIRHLVATEAPLNLEFRVRTRSGDERWLHARGRALRSGGHVVRAAGTLFDVTDVRLAGEAQRARLSAESASRAKTDFLSRISHELRTPLNAMLGFAQMFDHDAVESLTEPQHQRIRLIRQAGWHLVALIDDMMDIAAIEAGRMQVAMRGVDIGAVIDEAISLSHALARKHDVALEWTNDGACRVHVDGDIVRLRQILLNLLSNAIKYNRPGGRVRIDVESAGAAVRIAVVDDGLGMTHAQLAGLYEPFNRLGREHGGIEGSGIGMALTRQLVQLMGGRIDVESEVGCGTRVELRLDGHAFAEVPRRKQAPAPSPDCDRQPRGVVLYIEDNPVNVMLVEHFFARWADVRLEVATRGTDGVAVARSLQPDLVLLDMQLPDMDGHAVLEALRADPATAGLRVIAVSASALPEDVALALRGGAQAYWTKPLDLDRLAGNVGSLLAPAATA